MEPNQAENARNVPHSNILKIIATSCCLLCSCVFTLQVQLPMWVRLVEISICFLMNVNSNICTTELTMGETTRIMSRCVHSQHERMTGSYDWDDLLASSLFCLKKNDHCLEGEAEVDKRLDAQICKLGCLMQNLEVAQTTMNRTTNRTGISLEESGITKNCSAKKNCPRSCNMFDSQRFGSWFLQLGTETVTLTAALVLFSPTSAKRWAATAPATTECQNNIESTQFCNCSRFHQTSSCNCNRPLQLTNSLNSSWCVVAATSMNSGCGQHCDCNT